MIEDKARFELSVEGISADTSNHNVFSGAVFNMQDKWVKTDDDLPPVDFDTIIIRCFDMSIRFFPYRKGVNKRAPYKINSYLFDKGQCFVENWEDLIEKSKVGDKQGKVICFLLRHTNLCKELFHLAYVNATISVPIGFDTIGYAKAIAGEEWLDKPCFGTEEQIETNRIYHAAWDEKLKEKNKLHMREARKNKK